MTFSYRIKYSYSVVKFKVMTPQKNALLQVEESTFEHLVATVPDSGVQDGFDSDVPGSKAINEVETHDLERRRHSQHHKLRRKRMRKTKGPEGEEEDLKLTRRRRSGPLESHLRIRHWAGKDGELTGLSWPLPDIRQLTQQHLRFRRSESALNHEERPRRREIKWPEIQKDLSRWRRRSEWPELEKLLSCGPTNCTRVVCSVAPLNAGDNVVVRVRSRLWVDTIEKVQTYSLSLVNYNFVIYMQNSTFALLMIKFNCENYINIRHLLLLLLLNYNYHPVNEMSRMVSKFGGVRRIPLEFSRICHHIMSRHSWVCQR